MSIYKYTTGKMSNGRRTTPTWNLFGLSRALTITQSNTCSAAVLVDEFDTYRFQSNMNCQGVLASSSKSKLVSLRLLLQAHANPISRVGNKADPVPFERLLNFCDG